MAEAPTPQLAESKTSEESKPAPRVGVLMTVVEGADLDAALAIVRRQAYEPAPDIVVVGEVAEAPDGVEVMASLEEAIAAAGPDTDYLWLLHSDARPRPDALSKLVSEMERNDAALAGSKLLMAGTRDRLESVGSATDVFGEPYSGLEEGEIDLQQYDVVREVAFVRSASMLVRRDLAQGLKGLDVALPPIAAGLDFSQRARLAGGRVISVPSSEVYHQGRCSEGEESWREQAGRIRAMLTAYSPLTLLWVVSYDFLVSLLDSAGNLLLLRWEPALRHLQSWLWNIYRLPSTIALRRRFRPVRSAGDEELFRFQARGSVRLRELGAELSARVLSLFDEDQALVRSTRRLGSAPGMWGAVVAVLLVFLGVWSLVFSGVPDTGFSFPLESASTALDRWLGDWNEAGLGSPAAVHPSTGPVGVVSWVIPGSDEAARTLVTIGFGLLAVLGMGRLAGRLGVTGPGRYLAGMVAIAGPGTTALAGEGSWLALGASAALPWAAGAAIGPPGTRGDRLSGYGWAILTGALLGSLSPLLAVAPLVFVALWRVWGGKEARLLTGLAGLVAGVVAGGSFLLGDPGWVTDAGRRLGVVVPLFWPVLIVVAVTPVVLLGAAQRRLAIVGGIVSLVGLVGARAPYGGPGVEEAALVLASFGAALVVAAGLDSFSAEARRVLAAVTSAAVLVLSVGAVADGRLGLPSDEINERLGFASTLAGEHGPGRILIASIERGDIPGEARAGPGFWYRLVDGERMTLDEVWLPAPRVGDEALAAAIETISTGSELRPGEHLAPFAIEWVVLVGPEFRLDEALVAQLDLVPTPLDPDARVFENPGAAPMAQAGEDSTWVRSGTGFAGDPGSGRVDLAVNHDDGWQPAPARVGWHASVGAANGRAGFDAGAARTALPWATFVLLAGSLALIGVGRARR